MRPPDPDRQVVAVFAALTDPIRRALLDELAHAEPATVTDLARRLPVSRQAVAKHLGQLAEARFDQPRRADRPPSPLRLEPAAIRTAQVWPAKLANQWDDRLAALEHALDTTNTND
jgi:predicted ArsR family transcriptional regulator